MTKVILRRQGMTLVPVEAESLAVLHGIKDGAEVIGDLRGARNILQLRLFWSLVDIVAESTDLPSYVVKNDAAMNLGFTTTWVGLDGQMHIEPKSIAVESMTQAEFDQFFTRAVNLFASWINADHRDLLRRFNDLASDKRYEGMRHG